MDEWPALPYSEWCETLDTLHMYTQVVGKLRLALSPFEPEWANVGLYLTARGLGTSPIPNGLATFEAEFDFIDHALILRTSDGDVASINLVPDIGPLPVAAFHAEVLAWLDRLGVDATITDLPQEVPDPIPFSQDIVHASYDPEYVHRFWRVLRQVDVVMKRYRARFWGKTSPVHFFWGSFDLANTRYCGRHAAPPPGAGPIMLKAEDAEQIAVGFWAGDRRTPFPAFYAYGYPRPPGCEDAACQPESAGWVEPAGLFILPYEDVRTSPDPAGAITQFLDSTYQACAQLMGWPADLVLQPPARG